MLLSELQEQAFCIAWASHMVKEDFSYVVCRLTHFVIPALI